MVSVEKINAWAVVLKKQSETFATTGRPETAREMLAACRCLEAALTAHLMKFEIKGRDTIHGEE